MLNLRQSLSSTLVGADKIPIVYKLKYIRGNNEVFISFTDFTESYGPIRL